MSFGIGPFRCTGPEQNVPRLAAGAQRMQKVSGHGANERSWAEEEAILITTYFDITHTHVRPHAGDINDGAACHL